LSNESSKYLISAIISTYNSERFIRGKIEDLLQQTIFDKLEIVIVNSGSQQNEEEIIKEYIEKYPNIKYIRTEERETIYKAWNRGIKISNGKYITNTNTDDRLKENALEILSTELEKYPNVGVVYADQYITTMQNQGYREANNNKIYYFPHYKFIHLLDRCLIGSQPMWRASIHFSDAIWFNEKFEVCGDHDFYIRVAERYELKHLELVLGTFYKSPDRTNKEYQNVKKTYFEGFSNTFYHTQKFVNSLSQVETKKFFNKNIFFVSMPLLWYKVYNKTRLSLFPNAHFQYPEYSFLLIVLIYKKWNDAENVKKYANKFLKWGKSVRIKRVLDSTKSKSDFIKPILELNDNE